MKRSDYRRWARLYDRQAQGECLSEREQAELESLQNVCAASRHELFVMAELQRLVSPSHTSSPLSEDDRVIVEQALAVVSARDKVVPLHGRQFAAPDAEASRERSRFSHQPDSARLPRVRRWFFPALAGGAVAASAAAAVWWSEGNEAAPSQLPSVSKRPVAVELTFTSGKVLVNGRPRVVSASALEPSSRLEVGAGRACLAIDSHTDVCLDAHSSVVLDAQQGSARTLRLIKGRVAAVLEKRPAEESFSIVSGPLSATALGTAFAVERDDSDATVTVMEGRVQVKASGRLETVAAGEQLVNTEHGLEATRGITRAEQLRHWSLMAARKLWQQPSVGIVHIDSLPERAEVTLDGIRLGSTPLSLVAASGGHRIELELSGHRLRREDFRLTPGQEKRVSLALEQRAPDGRGAPASKTTAAAGGSVPEPPSAERLLERARRLVRQGEWQAAVNAYRRLLSSHPRSPESHTVLVALGQLELDRLGQPDRALRSFDRYLRAGGGLAQEARFGRLRALRALGDASGEATAIREYLTQYPGSVDGPALEGRLSRLEGK